MPDLQNRKLSRIVLTIGAIFLLAIAAAVVWLNSNYREIIKKKLPEISQKASDSSYKVETGDVAIDIPGRRVVFTNLRLTPDTAQLARLRSDYKLPPLIYDVRIGRLELNGISWERLVAEKLLDCDQIRVISPVVKVNRTSKEKPEKSDEQKPPPKFQSIVAREVVIENPEIVFSDSAVAQPTSYTLKGGRTVLSEWEFDLKKPMDSDKLFYARRVAMHFTSFNIQNAQALYRVKSGAISFDNGANTAAVSDLTIVPAVSREEFYRLTGYQKEIYELKIPRLGLNGMNWKQLLSGNTLSVQSASLENAFIGIYMSRVPPPNPESKNGKFPHQMLMALKMPVNIPLLTIRNGGFDYTEKNQKTMQEGTIAMRSVNGSIRNLTNIPAIVRQNQSCDITLNGSFKESPIRAVFRFDLTSKKGAFSVDGSLGAMDGTRLNDITKPLALTEIEKLSIDGITFRINGNQQGASARMTMKYGDLKVALLKPDDGALEENGFTSLLANHLLTHGSNPSGGGTRSVSPVVVRDDKKSFFNLIWKTLFTGILQTASRKLIKIDKVVNKRMEKQEEKRREEEPPKPAGKRRFK